VLYINMGAVDKKLLHTEAMVKDAHVVSLRELTMGRA